MHRTPQVEKMDEAENEEEDPEEEVSYEEDEGKRQRSMVMMERKLQRKSWSMRTGIL